jgi:FkbM family methyltransferase
VGGFDAIRVEGTMPGTAHVELRGGSRILAESDAHGPFGLEAELDGGRQIVELVVDTAHLVPDDPRELGATIRRVSLRAPSGWVDMDLGSDTEAVLRTSATDAWIDSLIDLTEERGAGIDDLFFEARGPHSRQMQEWIAEHAGDYDVVLVQGTPFAPIAWVPPIARSRGVPVVLLPHFHVEDRYYHWKGYYRAFRDADCVLGAPDSTKEQFFDKIDAPVEIVAGGGIDLDEFAAERLERCRDEFMRVRDSSRPYALVLGRKAGGKRYSLVLEAARMAGAEFDIVMIGPDDDRLPIEQPGVHYYGARPRDFVLGALAGCACLVNMSESESFGIVLVEAWAAGRPVIAQRRCVAFAELVQHGANGFLAESPGEIREGISRYLADPGMAAEHGAAGKAVAQRFSWSALAAQVRAAIVEKMFGAVEGPRRVATAPQLDVTAFCRDAVEATLAQLRRGELHDGDFAAFRLWKDLRVECIMDIGANRGQSLASLHTLFPDARIHSFEANPIFFEMLESVAASLGDHCRIHRHGLGKEDGTLNLYVPWAGNQPFLEESSTHLEYFDKPWVSHKFVERGGLQLQKVSATIRRGDELGLVPQVMKIDVEGAEHDVIAGLARTIQHAKPILLVENSDYHRVTATLAGFGYRPFRYDPFGGRMVPFFGETTNTFYLHETAHAGLHDAR